MPSSLSDSAKIASKSASMAAACCAALSVYYVALRGAALCKDLCGSSHSFGALPRALALARSSKNTSLELAASNLLAASPDRANPLARCVEHPSVRWNYVFRSPGPCLHLSVFCTCFTRALMSVRDILLLLEPVYTHPPHK